MYGNKNLITLWILFIAKEKYLKSKRQYKQLKGK
jgi:hypothetical protein